MGIRGLGPMFVATALALAGCAGGKGARDVAPADVPVPSEDVPGDVSTADVPEVAPGDSLDDTEAEGAGDATGDASDVPVKSEAPILLLEKQVLDTTWGSDPQFPLDGSRESPHVRVSACGTVGVLFRDVVKSPDGSFDTSVVAQVFAGTGVSAPPRGYLATAAKKDAPLPTSGTLVFSDEATGCKPRVWRASDVRAGYDLWTLKDDGTWQSLDALPGLEVALGKLPAAVRHLAADMDGLGQMHLLFEATFASGDPASVHAWVKDGAWTIARFQPPSTDGGCFGYAFASGGALHAVCLKGGDIVHGLLDGAGWSYATAVAAGDASAVLLPTSIALGGYDVPLIAYTRLQRIEDGPNGTPDYAYAQLELAMQAQDGSWGSQVIVQETDGYLGGDGKRFTGWAPMVVVPSGSGGIHVAFSDIAASHGSDLVQQFDPGQARYAFRTGSDWKLATIFRQRLLATDHRSDLGWNPLIGVSPNGKQAAFLVLEQQRDKVLPTEGPVPGTIRLQLVRTSR